MFLKKYQYLEEFINSNTSEAHHNWFGSVSMQEINEAEYRLAFQFPASLKQFWLEVGYGALATSINFINTIHNNRIMYPEQIADIMLLKDESEFVIPGIGEYFEEGYIKDDDIIFFEIGDMSSFLVMKPNSDKPNAVYDMIGRVIEEDFERFIWRLYYESPDYYLRIYPTPE